jgi:hypothetical protein
MPAQARTVAASGLIVEDQRARRIRRPVDLLRCLLAVLGIVVAVGIGLLAGATARGVQIDAVGASSRLPHPVLALLGVAATLALLLAPAALAIRQLTRRQSRRLTEAVLTGGATIALVALANTALLHGAAAPLYDALAIQRAGAAGPLDGYLAGLAAYATIIGLTGPSRWRTALWLAVGVYAIATLATGFVRVLGNFPAFGFFAHNFVSTPFSVTYGQLVAVAAATLISVLNYIGIKRAGDFQLVFTFVKVAIILSIVVIGLGYSGGNWQNFAGSFTGAKGGMSGFMLALVAALWAYDGWNDLNMVSGEIRNPERGRIEAMQLRERGIHCIIDGGALARMRLRHVRLPKHATIDEFHDIEWRAGNTGVLAIEHRLGDRKTPRVERADDTELAIDRVGGREQFPRRLAPEHIAAAGNLQQIGRVRLTALELAHHERGVEFRQAGSKEGLQPTDINGERRRNFLGAGEC